MPFQPGPMTRAVSIRVMGPETATQPAGSDASGSCPATSPRGPMVAIGSDRPWPADPIRDALIAMRDASFP